MPVEFAFIGAGGIAGQHLEHIEDHENATVVAVCDVDSGVAEEAAEPFDADVYTDHHDLYEEGDFDAVVIAIPPFAHEDQERLAAEHDVDLFVEKPLALDPETAAENEEIIEDAGIVSQVGHMARYADSVQRASELIEGRTLAMIDGHWWSGLPGDSDHWWRQKDRSGGQIIEQATHTFDIVRYFASDVETVRAAGSQKVHTDEIDFDDSTATTMTHEDGTVSTVTATSTGEEDSANEVQLIGDGFSLHVDLWGDTLSGSIEGEEIDYSGESGTYGPEMDAFIEAVETGDDSGLHSPYADARKTFETTLAVDRAVRSDEVEEVRE